MTLKLAVLVSGQGRTFSNILDCIDNQTLPATVEVLVSTRSESQALDRARECKIKSYFVSYKKLGNQAAADLIYDHCQDVDLIVMAGFLKHFSVAPRWEGRIVNIHPSLLPKYGGKGFYGHRVHTAVLEDGETQTGCTVHVVDDQYDHGRILDQIVVPVEPDDTPEILADRVFEQEKILYPRVLKKIANGNWPLPL